MKRIYILLLTLAALSSASSLRAQTQANLEDWKKIKNWHGKVTVLSGNELEMAGVRCRLFGVRVSANAETAERAKRFLELYMKRFGSFFSIYNSDQPVNAKDGAPLIWLMGHSNGGWAQEALVEAGLVEVDDSGFEDYRFSTEGKSGPVQYRWKQCLQEAVADRKAGKRPKFDPNLD